MLNNIKYFSNISNLILLGIIGALLGMYCFIRFRMHKSSANKLDTYFTIKQIQGFLSSIISAVRKGKSSFGNAITNIKEMQLMEQCNTQMEKIISMFPGVDFHVINSYIDSLELSDEVFYSKQGEITKFIVEELKLDNFMYNDFINCKTLYEYIEEYIECYYVLFYRGIYVYSKTWRYSYVTRMTSKYLSDGTMEIKDIMVQKEFYLRKYSIVLEDELSLTRGNILSHSNLEKNKGRKDIKILFGHIFKETVYYVSIKQKSGDEISNERELYTNYFYIKDRRIYNTFSFFLKWFEFRKKYLIFRYQVYYFFYHIFKRKKRFDYWCMELLKFRKKKYYFDCCLRYFKSLANVDYWIYDYDKYENLGKENTESYKRYDEYILTFDLRDTIGNYNTHEYSFIMTLLNALSRVYDTKFNTGYKSKELIMEQALFLFDKFIKNEKEKFEKSLKEERKRGLYYDYDD